MEAVSYTHLLRPYGEIISKPFEVKHTVSGIRSLIEQIQSIDGESRIVMEPVSYTHLDVYKRQFFGFRKQLEYKCSDKGIQLIVADRFYPSSKLCSCCGNIKKDLKLSDRVYRCECGNMIDRDLDVYKRQALSSLEQLKNLM